MVNIKRRYIVSKDTKSWAYCCYQEGYSYTPVFGSIGSKQKANAVCKTMNESINGKQYKMGKKKISIPIVYNGN